MFPIALDLTRIPVLLAGQGELLLKRLVYLDEAQAQRVVVFSPLPSDSLRRAAGKRLVEKLPTGNDIRDYPLVMVAGLDRRTSESIAASARALNRLVNVEDVNELCDFYYTANIRRGDLVIAVSTSGASPTLARKIRDAIAVLFGAEWTERVREMALLRQRWKAQGAGMEQLIARSEQFLTEKGWLMFSPSPCKGEGRGGDASVPQALSQKLTPSLTLPLAGRGNKTGDAA